MITWRKVMGSGQMLVPNLIFIAAIRCCNLNPVPHLYGVSPDAGNQGTDVHVTISGRDFSGPCGVPVVRIDNYIGGGSPPGYLGVWTDFDGNRDPYTDTEISLTLHIDPSAALTLHTITVETNGESNVAFFSVARAGCPLPPRLFTVVSDNGATLRPGETVPFRFEGANLLNNNPEVHISNMLAPGAHVAPGPYNVQGVFGFEYFVADITADPGLPGYPSNGGSYQIYLTTSGGTNCAANSNPVYITLDASQPPPSPTPGGTPSLNTITPSHISRFASQFTSVSIKFQGTGGFGINHEILVDQNSTISGFATLNEYQSDRDQVVVGLPTMNLPTGPDAFVTVRVHNLSNGTVSNPQILFLDDPAPNAPVVAANFCADFHRGDSAGNLYIEGENLQGITAQSFSGVPGLTFSNILATAPIFGEGSEAFYIEVSADASAPISADEATNLVITTVDGQSNLFWIHILPPR